MLDAKAMLLPVRSAAGLHGTPNERSESPCECPFACRGRPLAASLAQSVRCRRNESARIATAHRYTPALHGLRCRPLDSPPSCMRIRAAATCIAIACACSCGVFACLLGRGRVSRRNRPCTHLSCIYPQQQLADLTYRSQVASATSVTLGVQACACARACASAHAARSDGNHPSPPRMRIFSQQQLADDTPLVLSPHCAVGVH